MAGINPSYLLFQSRLFPLLPYLIYEAGKISKTGPKLSPQSEKVFLAGQEQSILILGESTAAGVGASAAGFTLSSYLHQLFLEKYSFYNLGKNGIRVGEVLPHFKSDLAELNSTKEGILLFLGANDCFKLTNPSAFYKSLQSLVASLQTQFEPKWIYLADIPPVHLFPAFSSLMKSYLYRQREFLRNEMKKLASKNNRLIFQEISLDLVPDFFSTDGIHPSDLGYQKIAEFTYEGIKEYLQGEE
ncbi:MAG: GDSL-type esterase/lipase family protein [Algoriphagus sp.]|uniref:SGNH/GDSL hydrolase family protein n=1 Tax=Algoriphagus sp. TaxID=1872435 RepID=UPI0026306A10|nr:GDSL-type esterase/lipase family protein [Algoriphagus sp.]MDG1276400.1 GDSL-type esterase/lipase family protein [Algoriphagus sp.]